MKIVSAFLDGVRRVTGAPAVLFGLLLVTLLVALPLGAALAGMIRDSLGDSLAAETAASGVNNDWWEEFSAGATGVGRGFSPRIIGFGGVLDNVSSLIDNRDHPLVIAGAGVAYVICWVFLVGGVLDRYARDRRVRAPAFFAACGVFFFRFLRLAIVAFLVYGFLFAYLHPWLFEGFYRWATQDWVVERNAFMLRLALYAVFGLVLAACSLVLDYAKVRAVVEDRRSMVGALLAALRFVRHRPAATCGLYLLDVALFVVLLVLYSLVAPGAGRSGWSMWGGAFVAELYVLVRLWVKLVFYASEIALFQASLAHAGYAAAPVAVWPDSPAAEAIRPPETGPAAAAPREEGRPAPGNDQG